MDAGYQHEDTTTSLTDTYKVGIKEFRRRPHDWIETRFVDASVEYFEVADETNTEFLLIPGISWSHTFPINYDDDAPGQGPPGVAEAERDHGASSARTPSSCRPTCPAS